MPELEDVEWDLIMRGSVEWTQAHSLLRGYCETYYKGEYRDAWHRQQYVLIYKEWLKLSRTEEAIKEQGGGDLDKWKKGGGEGSSLWWKGASVSKEELRVMIQGERERRRNDARMERERKKAL